MFKSRQQSGTCQNLYDRANDYLKLWLCSYIASKKIHKQEASKKMTE